MPLANLAESGLTATPESLRPIMFLLFLAGLWHCCLGYVWSRAALAISSLAAGVLLVDAGLNLLDSQPPGAACFLAYLAAGALLALASWFLFRLYFALVVLVLTATVYMLLSPNVAAGVVFGGIVGLGLGVLAWLFTRTLIVLATSMYGALIAVAAASWVLMPDLWPALIASPADHVPAIVVLAVLAAAVAVAAAYVQFVYTSRLRVALSPPEEPATGRPAPKRKAYVTTRDGRKRRAARPAVA